MYKNTIFYRCVRDAALFLQKPRDYLYSFRLSSNSLVQMHPFHPKVRKLGRGLAATIQKKFPEVTVHFFGSAALGIDGRNDIDLMIDCDGTCIGKYISYLCSLFGEPVKRRPLEVKWSSHKNDIAIDVTLIDSNHVVRNTLLRTYNTISNNPHLIHEYDKLKKESIGTSLQEYQRRRMAFFNRIDRIQFLNRSFLIFRNVFTSIRPVSSTI